MLLLLVCSLGFVGWQVLTRPTKEQTVGCLAELERLRIHTRLELFETYRTGKFVENGLKFGDMKIKIRDIHKKDLFYKKHYSRKCILITVPEVVGKILYDLPDSQPVYRCKYHKNHIITAGELKI